jgi:hypothetical protein
MKTYVKSRFSTEYLVLEIRQCDKLLCLDIKRNKECVINKNVIVSGDDMIMKSFMSQDISDNKPVEAVSGNRREGVMCADVIVPRPSSPWHRVDPEHVDEVRCNTYELLLAVPRIEPNDFGERHDQALHEAMEALRTQLRGGETPF